MIVRTGVVLTFLIMCAGIAYTDIRKQKIYDEAIAALCVPAIVSFFAFPEISPLSRGLGGISVSGIMLLCCLIKPGAFGGGDIKFMVAAGLFLGLERTIFAGIWSVFAGALWSVGLIVRRRIGKGRKGKVRKESFAFGPALCLGSVIALFCSI